MSGAWRPAAVAVCVPVRNEAALLPALLDSLAAQEAAGAFTLCLVFDGCTDGSERLVAARAAALPFDVRIERLPAAAEPNAGRARRAALALGERTAGGAAPAALLTTDADSVPARDWVAATIGALGAADLVAGRIVRDPTFRDPEQDRLEQYYDRLFAMRRAIDPVPWEARATHHCTGGASLAFRAEAYAALGGFAERRSGEDAAIVDAAHRAGYRVRRDRAVLVATSSRLVGRAVGGLADHLRQLAEDTARDAIKVAHPAGAAWQYAGHAAARRAYAWLRRDDVAAVLAERIGIEMAVLRETAAHSPNAEAFAMRVVPGPRGGERPVGLDEAVAALALLVGERRERAA